MFQNKPYFVFCIDGGFSEWDAKNSKTQGVGGSEFSMIKLASGIQKSGLYEVFVFCNCITEHCFEEVEYRFLESYTDFIYTNEIDTVLISRYPQYLPVTYKSNKVKKVFLIFHDLIPNGEIIIRNEKLQNILCLSKWHTENIKSMFPPLQDLVVEFNHGIDIEEFDKIQNESNIEKVPYRFIYSSFAHRGLRELLLLWRIIIEKYPQASLYIHCDIEHPWVNSLCEDEMKEIKLILNEYLENNDKYHITYKGWTSKNELYTSWLQATVWFYPTSFVETFCLTALEAGISKTLAISCNLGALQDTIGERGILINGNTKTPEWQKDALDKLFNILDESNTETKEKYIEMNYEWASKLSWNNRINDFITNFLTPKTTIPSISSVEEIKEEIKEESINIIEQTLIKVASYFNFKYNKKPTKILEIGNVFISSKNTLTNLIPNSNFTLVTNTNHVMKNIQNIFEDDFCIIETDDIVSSLEDLKKKPPKFNFVIFDQNIYNDLKTLQNLNLAFQLVQKNGLFLIKKNLFKAEFINGIADIFLNYNKTFLQIIEENDSIICLEKLF